MLRLSESGRISALKKHSKETPYGALKINHKYNFMYKKIPAWTVHLLTASGVLIALLTLFEIHNQHYINALWLMCAAIFIDAIDGTLARLVNIKEVIPNIDGALLDNIVDFLNYVVTPCFFILLCPDLVPSPMVWPILIAVSLSSCYQFTQSDAKTEDHFFKGFPCYWNLVVLYLYVFRCVY